LAVGQPQDVISVSGVHRGQISVQA
jgi:hypothetical protein